MVHSSPDQHDQIIFVSILRLFGAVLFLVLFGITGFGFLASFEQPGITVWKLGYGLGGLLLFLASVGLLFQAIRGFQGGKTR